MKRAAIIKIYRLLQEDPPYWHTDTDEMPHLLDGTGEQLLADLRLLLDAGAYVVQEHDVGNERDLLAEAVENVRALLPEDDNDA